MTKVLVPLDLSEHSNAILPVVSNLFSPSEDVTIVLLTVVGPSEAVMRSGAGHELDPISVVASFAPATISALSKGDLSKKGEYSFAGVRKELAQTLEERASELREHGFQVEARVGFGEPAVVIIDYARDNDVDVIAMCTHARRGLAQAMFGSVASAVLSSGVAPVLLQHPMDGS